MPETHPKITAGIDVGKAHLELSINAGSPSPKPAPTTRRASPP